MKKIFILFAVGMFLYVLSSCQDEKNVEDLIVTAKLSEIEHTSAIGGGFITTEEDVLEMGVCISVDNSLPTIINDTVRARNMKKGAFACHIVDLVPNTEYNVRAYIKVGSDFRYGNVVKFITAREPGVPEIGVITLKEFSESSAVLSCPITFNGGLKGEDIVKGVVYTTNRQALPEGEINLTSENVNDKLDYVYTTEKMNPKDSVFTVSIQSLLPKTTYYCKAFIKNDFGTGFSEEFSFDTQEKLTPLVSITRFDENEMVSYTSVKGYGNLAHAGASDIIEKGFCAGTSDKAIDAKLRIVADNTDLGDYDLVLEGLQPNTIYYMWSYAKNSNGIAYSEEPVSFKTLPISEPIIESAPYAMNMTMLQGSSNSVNVSANIMRTGGSNITERGFCYADVPGPTVSSQKIIISGTALGEISTTIKNLSPGKVYYVRPYAVNTATGVGYGEAITFKIPDLSELVYIPGTTYSPKCLKVTDTSLSDFYVAKFEVTTDEFAEFLTAYGATGDNFNTHINSDFPNKPLIVYNPDINPAQASFQYHAASNSWSAAEGRSGKAAGFISWYGAYEYAKWKGGMIPPAAYWEYAAIGGGSSSGFKYSGSNDVLEVGWTDGAALETPGLKKENELGIFDMTGNTWEWINETRDDVTGYRKGGSINEKSNSKHFLVTNTVSTISRVSPNWNMGFRYFRIK